MRDYILFYINGQRHQVQGEIVFQPLSDYLRYEQGLVGTKVVCAEGDCGACTVLMGKLKDGQLDYSVVNSCIQYVYQVDCLHIITVERLQQGAQLHPVQQAMIDLFGSQCGYCTPGFVVAMAGLLEYNPRPTEQEVRDGLTGNLCRCTGYRPIISAALSIAPESILPLKAQFPETEMVESFQTYSQQSIAISYEDTITGKPIIKRFFNPVSVAETIQHKQQFPEATLVAGGTDISVQMNKDRIEPLTIISLSNIPNLEQLQICDGYLQIGAKTSWTAMEVFCEKELPEFHKILKVFASPQIKNVGTMAGNIANASPIADSLPLLFVTHAEVELAGPKGNRWVDINQFYHGYKNIELQSDEIITQIRIPVPKTNQILKLYKVSKRKDLDISTFTAGFLLEVEDSTIKKIHIAYGGVGPVVLRLSNTEKFLQGKTITLAHFQNAAKLARHEITPITDVRASEKYRLQLAENTLIKLFYELVETNEFK